MAVMVDDILDKLTHTTIDNCYAYAWWNQHRGEEFKDVAKLWINAKSFDVETASMIVGAFWKKFDDDTKEQVKIIVKSIPALKSSVMRNTRLSKNERKTITS